MQQHHIPFSKVGYLFLILFLMGAASFGVVFFFASHQVIDFSVLEHTLGGKPTILLDDQGNEWARFEFDRRTPIVFENVPQHLIDAFVAAEDRNFFHHRGISWKGIIRSIVINLYHQARKQGASTITQQLVRLLFFDSRKTFTRKIKEQWYALLIEQQFSKEFILTTYLNNIYFGSGIYGVQAAAQRFWGIPASELSIQQSALLAAIVRCPKQYSPLHCPQAAMNRRNLVLQLMCQISCISDEQYQLALREPLGIVEKCQDYCIAPHAKEMIRQQLEELFGKDALYHEGFVVQTTLSANMQYHAEKAFKKQCDRLREEFNLPLDGALLSIDVHTGGMKALVGGYDFVTSKFNRVIQARRQMGSIFKPLIYALAIEQGATFADTQVDEPLVIENHGALWRPNNYNMHFDGEVTLAHALTRSSNIVAIKTLMNVGIPHVVALAKRCHLAGPFPAYPSLALGCVDATLKEAVGMFNIFADGGVFVEPHVMRWVKNRWGTKIWKMAPLKERIFSSVVSDQVAHVLGLGLARLRHLSPNKWIDFQAISKTGTTNESRTCWFIGAGPQYTTGIYIGCDDNRSMGKNIYPVRTAFPIWRALHCTVPSPVKNFTFDPSLHMIHVDRYTGLESKNLHAKGTISILT